LAHWGLSSHEKIIIIVNINFIVMYNLHLCYVHMLVYVNYYKHLVVVSYEFLTLAEG